MFLMVIGITAKLSARKRVHMDLQGATGLPPLLSILERPESLNLPGYTTHQNMTKEGTEVAVELPAAFPASRSILIKCANYHFNRNHHHQAIFKNAALLLGFALTLYTLSFCFRTTSPPSPPPVFSSEKHSVKRLSLPSSAYSLSPPVPCVTKMDDNDIPFFAPYHTNITPADPKLQPVTGYSHGVMAAGRNFLAGAKKSKGGRIFLGYWLYWFSAFRTHLQGLPYIPFFKVISTCASQIQRHISTSFRRTSTAGWYLDAALSSSSDKPDRRLLGFSANDPAILAFSFSFGKDLQDEHPPMFSEI
ncbi:uncharacterized protein EV420DRAFT_1481224 [Desarmillaria tabescens]|uniref:Uncharacterized protein n=1 Tax=Armillaria tabescens TaxID=1929756 RepID=A0AA39K7L2_ARMTA|nr:uncharacterized protein EV420DRAFT_1481224 [Desarmillaria tabescens]KAK0455783.1 hypothetical protein EV420DRAFT_1481224 [Desarmillaria tabescens]